MTPQPNTPPVSPTGTPVLPQSVIRIAAPLFALVTAVAFIPEAAKTQGVDLATLLPPWSSTVFGVCKLAVAIGVYLGIKSQGQRIAAPMVLLCACAGLTFASCATTTPAIVITGHTIVLTEQTYTATGEAVDSFYASGAMSKATHDKWLDFQKRWKAASEMATKLYDSASDQSDSPQAPTIVAQAEAILASVIAELGTWETLVAQLVHPNTADGGS